MEESERRIIEVLLETEGERGQVLLEQYRRATVLRREFTGVGFYTYFSVPSDVAKVDIEREAVGRPILIEIEGNSEGASAVLWVLDGVLHSLEVFTFIGPWPENAQIKSIG